ncbi:MAG: hypothetical protein HYW09_00435 [Candidatus Niyogibacteria bacterium]|nr:hypothetical protein [Candidatus Niyogibacteria bacterium]
MAIKYESAPPMREGREYEMDLVGRPDFRPDTPQESLRCLRDPSCVENNSRLFKEFEKYYAGDPTQPKRAFLRDLRIEIIDQLDLETEDEMNAVGVFPALDTTLDARGIDFFVSYLDPAKKKKIRIAGDVTTDTPLSKEERVGDPRLLNKILIYGDVGDECAKGDKECLEVIGRYAEKFVSSIKARQAMY